MATVDRMNRTLRLVPSSENLKTRYLHIHNGNLYFKGDTTYAVCLNFIKSDTNMQLDSTSLQTAINIGGDIKVVKIDDSTAKFTNGDQSLTIAYTPIDEPPTINIPDKSLYTDMPEFMKYCKPLFGIMDKYSLAGTFHQDEFVGAIVASNRVLGCVAVESPDAIDMELTRIQDVLSAAIASSAKVHVDGKKIGFYIEGDGYEVYAQTSLTPSTVNSKMRDLAMSVLRGRVESEGNIIQLKVKGQEFLKINPTVEKIRTGGYIVFEADEGQTKVKATDSINSEYEAFIDSSASGKVVFSSRIIDRSVLEFLSSAIGKMATENFLISINSDMARMVVRTEELPNNVKMFAVMAVNFKVV